MTCLNFILYFAHVLVARYSVILWRSWSHFSLIAGSMKAETKKIKRCVLYSTILWTKGLKNHVFTREFGNDGHGKFGKRVLIPAIRHPKNARVCVGLIHCVPILSKGIGHHAIATCQSQPAVNLFLSGLWYFQKNTYCNGKNDSAEEMWNKMVL